tara:strand:- start:516 stop:740 length:225 start_codon:yes stop_codon:yes gene_type:complete
MKTRKFGGRTDYENMNPTERNFEKAHLKAYLKGKPIFRHGHRPVYLEYPDGRKEKVGSDRIWHKTKVLYEDPTP